MNSQKKNWNSQNLLLRETLKPNSVNEKIRRKMEK